MINIISSLLSHLIIIISLVNYILLLFMHLTNLFVKSCDINKYKIKSIVFNYLISFVYIIIFFISIYIWRIFNVNYELNVKYFFDNIHRVWLINFSHIYYIYQIYLLITIIILIIGFFLISFKIHKICLLMLYQLYIYNYHNNAKRSFKNEIHLTLSFIGNQDIITYFVSKLSYKITQKFDNERLVAKTLPWYHFQSILNFLIYYRFKETQLLLKLSPIIILLYDLLFNNYIISHLYIYLIFYIPIMTFKRITTTCVDNANELSRFLHKLYYVKEKNILYAISTKDKPILDLFLISGLKSNLELLDTQYYLTSVMRFILQYPERNTWVNNNGDYLHLTPSGCVFEEVEEEITLFDIKTNEGLIAFKNSGEMFTTKIVYKLGSEWILICHKGENSLIYPEIENEEVD